MASSIELSPITSTQEQEPTKEPPTIELTIEPLIPPAPPSTPESEPEQKTPEQKTPEQKTPEPESEQKPEQTPEPKTPESKPEPTPSPPKILITRFKPRRRQLPNKRAIYDSVLATLKEKVSNISIRPSTLYLVIKYVMEEIENTPTKGAEQKEMALKLIRVLTIDLTEGADEKVLLQLLDDGTIGNMIDLIVDASKGKLNINAVASVGAGFFNNCIPFLCSTKSKQSTT